MWIPDLGGDLFGALGSLLASTSSITVASGILNLWMQDPTRSAAGFHELVAKYGPVGADRDLYLTHPAWRVQSASASPGSAKTALIDHRQIRARPSDVPPNLVATSATRMRDGWRHRLPGAALPVPSPAACSGRGILSDASK